MVNMSSKIAAVGLALQLAANTSQSAEGSLGGGAQDQHRKPDPAASAGGSARADKFLDVPATPEKGLSVSRPTRDSELLSIAKRGTMQDVELLKKLYASPGMPEESRGQILRAAGLLAVEHSGSIAGAAARRFVLDRTHDTVSKLSDIATETTKHLLANSKEQITKELGGTAQPTTVTPLTVEAAKSLTKQQVEDIFRTHFKIHTEYSDLGPLGSAAAIGSPDTLKAEANVLLKRFATATPHLVTDPAKGAAEVAGTQAALRYPVLGTAQISKSTIDGLAGEDPKQAEAALKTLNQLREYNEVMGRRLAEARVSIAAVNPSLLGTTEKPGDVETLVAARSQTLMKFYDEAVSTGEGSVRKLGENFQARQRIENLRR